jgi:hypothetical protein
VIALLIVNEFNSADSLIYLFKQVLIVDLEEVEGAFGV